MEWKEQERERESAREREGEGEAKNTITEKANARGSILQLTD